MEQEKDPRPVCLKKHFDSVGAEMIQNEKAIVYGYVMPIKSMIELYDRQVKLQNLQNWINVLAASYDRPVPPLIQALPENAMRIVQP